MYLWRGIKLNYMIQNAYYYIAISFTYKYLEISDKPEV